MGDEEIAKGEKFSSLKIRSLKLNFLLSNIRLGLNFLIPLLIFPYVSRVLGPESLGRVEFANSIVSYFVLFAALGIPTYGMREIARVRDDADERSKTVVELGIILLISIFISYFIYFLLVLFVPQLKVELLLFLIVAPTIFLSDFNFEWFYGGIEDQLFITIRYLIVKIIQVFATFLLIKNEDSLYMYAIIFVGLNSISTVFNIIRLKKYQTKIKFDSLNFGKHLKPSLCIFAAQIAASIYTQLDITMLGVIREKEDVGIYVVANKMVRMIILLVTSFSYVIIPRIENSLKNRDLKTYRDSLEKSLRFILILALPFFVGLEIVGDDVILIFAGEEYSDAIFAVRLLSPIILIVSFATFVGLEVLFANRKEIIYTISVSIAAFCNFFVNLMLIPRFGLYGAVVGTIVAESVGLFVMSIIGIKFLRDAKLKIQCWKYILSVVVMGLGVWGIKNVLQDMVIFVRFFVCFIVGVGLYSGILLATREKLILELLNNKEYRYRQ